MPNIHRTSAFTQRYDGLANVLRSECIVSQAFDPASPERPDTCTVTCVWDTGATNSVISPRLVEALKLVPTGRMPVNDARGTKISNTYIVNVMLPNNVEIPFLQVTEGILLGFDMLVGMDIISKGDFSVSCPEGKTVFSFRLPSAHEVDFVDGKVLQTPIRTRHLQQR